MARTARFSAAHLRRPALAALLALLAHVGISPADAAPRATPPVVYIVGDSITAGRIGHHGTGIGRAAKTVIPGSHSIGHPGRCLAFSPCIYDPPVLATFRSEVLSATPRPDVVVVEAGINDLAHISDGQFKAAYRQLVRWGADRGIAVLVSTITPLNARWPWQGAMEPQRRRVNAWLRTRPWSVDLAAVIEARDGSLPHRYDCGDGLHPNVRGTWLLTRALGVALKLREAALRTSTIDTRVPPGIGRMLVMPSSK